MLRDCMQQTKAFLQDRTAKSCELSESELKSIELAEFKAHKECYSEHVENLIIIHSHRTKSS